MDESKIVDTAQKMEVVQSSQTNNNQYSSILPSNLFSFFLFFTSIEVIITVFGVGQTTSKHQSLEIEGMSPRWVL